MVTPSDAGSFQNSLYELFIIDTAEVEVGSKIASYKLTETVLTDITEMEALDEIFDSRVDCWTPSPSFMDAFTIHSLAFLQFTRPVAQSGKIHLDRTADEWCIRAKAYEIPSVEVGNSWLPPPPTSYSSDKSDRWKHCYERRENRVPKDEGSYQNDKTKKLVLNHKFGP